MKDSLIIKKNLLDLDMQKYLQLTTTSIVIAFSYFIGIFIVIITNQVDLKDHKIYTLFIIVTVFVRGYSSALFISGLNKIQRISESIRNMLKESYK